MSFFGTSTISTILLALKEYLRWQAIKSEIECKRLVIDEMERIEDETKQLEIDIDAFRSRGEFDRADLMLDRAVRRAGLSVWISDVGKRADVQGSPQDDIGGGVCNQEAAGSDIGSDSSSPKSGS